jgi:hypothetical protein
VQVPLKMEANPGKTGGKAPRHRVTTVKMRSPRQHLARLLCPRTATFLKVCLEGSEQRTFAGDAFVVTPKGSDIGSDIREEGWAA